MLVSLRRAGSLPGSYLGVVIRCDPATGQELELVAVYGGFTGKQAAAQEVGIANRRLQAFNTAKTGGGVKSDLFKRHKLSSGSSAKFKGYAAGTQRAIIISADGKFAYCRFLICSIGSDEHLPSAFRVQPPSLYRVSEPEQLHG